MKNEQWKKCQQTRSPKESSWLHSVIVYTSNIMCFLGYEHWGLRLGKRSQCLRYAQSDVNRRLRVQSKLIKWPTWHIWLGFTHWSCLDNRKHKDKILTKSTWYYNSVALNWCAALHQQEGGSASVLCCHSPLVIKTKGQRLRWPSQVNWSVPQQTAEQ